MNKQRYFKVIKLVFSCFAIIIAVSLIHIYQVTRNNSVKNNRQLSRIDFKQAIDSVEACKIRSFVAHLPGVETTFFNVKSSSLVYTYALEKQTSINVFNELVHYGHYKAERYIADGATVKTGCPIMQGEHSFSNYIFGYFYKIFN